MEAVDDLLRDASLQGRVDEVAIAKYMYSPAAGGFMLRKRDNGSGRETARGKLKTVRGVTEVEHVKQVYAGAAPTMDYLSKMTDAQRAMLRCYPLNKV